MNIKLINEKAVEPKMENGVIEFSCTGISTEVARDGRLILTYSSGVEIEMPEDKIGMVVPSEKAPGHSLEFAGGLQTIKPGFKGEFVSRFKTNTDAIPAIYEEGDVFARMVILDIVNKELIKKEETQQAE